MYRRVLSDSPFNLGALTKQPLDDAYRVLSTKAVDGMRGTGAFSEPEEWHYDWEWSYTRDAWLDQVPTHGALTGLPPDQLTEVLEGIGAAIDRAGGGFTMRYTTVAVTATRTAEVR